MLFDYYIDTDLRTSKIFIAPSKIDKEHHFLIEFDKRYLADQTLKKLNAKITKNPIEDPSLYELLRKDESELGTLFIYKLK